MLNDNSDRTASEEIFHVNADATVNPEHIENRALREALMRVKKQNSSDLSAAHSTHASYSKRSA